MPKDEKTAFLGLPLPHSENNLETDVQRIRESLRKLDSFADVALDQVSQNSENLVSESAARHAVNKELSEQIAGISTQIGQGFDAGIIVRGKIEPDRLPGKLVPELPLPLELGGTGATSLDDARTILCIPREYSVLFDISGQWIPPDSGLYVIRMVAGGGGGGARGSYNRCAGGGGGGAFNFLQLDLKAGEVLDLVIGAGGQGQLYKNSFEAPGAECAGGNTLIIRNGQELAKVCGGGAGGNGNSGAGSGGGGGGGGGGLTGKGGGGGGAANNHAGFPGEGGAAGGKSASIAGDGTNDPIGGGGGGGGCNGGTYNGRGGSGYNSTGGFGGAPSTQPGGMGGHAIVSDEDLSGYGCGGQGGDYSSAENYDGKPGTSGAIKISWIK